jgi:hypothetical protein
MLDSTFTRRTGGSDRNLQPVAITAVDPTTRTATGITRTRYSVEINCAYATGDTITVPAVGEQWYVERFDMEWRLYGRIPFNDATLNIEPEEGQVSVGSASGPLELNGTEVRANGRVLRLNGVYYRDNGTTLQRSLTGQDDWEPIFANSTGGGGGTSGVLQMLANKLADIPATPEVVEFISKLSTQEAQALTSLATWADDLTTGGGAFGSLCDNAFFSDLRSLGTGTSPLDEIGSGFQNFMNGLVSLLFCQYSVEEDGDVTPTVLAERFSGLQDFFTGQNQTGNFLRGLQGLLPGGQQADNLLLDSVNGAVKFIQDLFDILLCADSQVAINPAAILTELGTVFDPLKNNPFLLGLQDFVVTANREATNLFTDAVEGTVKIIQDLFDALFCDFQLGNQAFTPQLIFDQLNDNIIEPLASNQFIIKLTDLAERMGVDFNNNLTGAIRGAVEFLQLTVGILSCNLTDDQVTKVDNLIETATGGLLPADIFDFLQNKLIKPLNNSFVQGLAEMFRETNNLNRSLLEDAIAGAEQLIEVIQDIFSCDADGTLVENIKDLVGPNAVGVTPAKIVKLLDDFFGTFRNNPFVTGLETFWTTLGNQATTTAQDAIRGANQFLETVFNVLLCKPLSVTPSSFQAILNLNETAAFTPAKVIQNIHDFTSFFGNNPFIKGLQSFWTTLGNTGENLIKDAVQGASKFFEYITDLILCKPNAGANLTAIKGLAGIGTGFTPAKFIADIDGFLDDFRNNDFLKGLRDFWEALGNTADNLLDGAVQGASKFFDFLFKVITCNATQADLNSILGLANSETATGVTPAALVKSIDDFFKPFKENNFLTGLQNLLGGNKTNNLIKDAIDGAIKFAETVFGLLTCSPSQPGPLINLSSLAGSALPGTSTPVGILAALKKTFLGTGLDANNQPQSGLLGNDWIKIFTGIAGRQGYTGNLLNNIADGFASVMDFIFDDILGGLFPLQNFRGILEDFPNGVVDWLEDLNLGKLLDPEGLGQWFQDNIFRPILKALTGLDDTELDALLDPKTAIATFFTNVRKFFGEGLIGNWLDNFGGGLLSGNFNPITALQTFISDVLVEGIDNLWDALVEGLTSASNLLVKALTGQPITGVLGEGLKAIKDFFGGFGNFDPLTGQNSLISQIVKEIVGEDGQFTLDDLGRFFSFTGDNSFANIFKLITDAITSGITDFTTGPIKALADFFDPTKTNSVFKGLVDAITTGATSFLSGPIKAIADFFNPTNSTNVFKNLVDVITGAANSFTAGLSTGPLKVLFDFFDPNKATNVFKNLVDAITNHTTAFANGPLKALADFFDFDKTASLLNTIVETMIGSNILSGNGPLAKLSQLFSGVSLTGGKSLVTQIVDQVNYIAEVLGLNSIVSSITKIDAIELENSYTLTFGGSPTGGTFTLAYGGQTTAAIPYSANPAITGPAIDAALDALTNIANGSNVTFANSKYTVSLNNTTSFLTLGTASLTGGTSPTLTVAQKFRGSLAALAQFFTGLNPFTGGSGTNLLQQIITETGSNIAEFVSRITKIDVEDLLNPLGALEKFFDGFTDIFNPDNGDNNLISQIVKKITGGVGTTMTNLQQFFNNLRGLFGTTDFLMPTGSGSGFFSQSFAANQFITNVLSKASAGLSNLIPSHVLSNLGLGQIDDLVKLITGIDPTTGQHANVLQTFFAGLGGINSAFTRTANSLVSQIANAITGKSGGNPLSDIKAFFGIGSGGLLDFSGNNTIPIINQIVKAITGKSGTSHPLVDIATFLGIGPTTDATTLNPFDGANSFIKQIVEKIVPSAAGLDQMKKFFDNLRTMFGLADNDFLADIANFKFADAATHFVNNVLSKAGTNPLIAITKIPGNILNVGITNINNLISTLTGGTTIDQFQHFFTNLRKFLNIGTTGTNVVNFFADPASFSVPNAINGFIKNIVKTATAIGEIPATLIEAFSPEKITGLIEKLTGKTAGAVEADLTTFFDNLRKTFNVGTGAGQINLLNPAATLSGLQDNLFTFVSGLQSGINSFITKSGLGTWLGATGTEINHFFTNLTKFFKLDFFKLAPTGTGAGTFNLQTAAGDFIENVINEATGFLINPLKILGINDSGTLKDDVSNRPLLSTLLGWVTGNTTTNAFDNFFTNIKNFFGGNINLLGTTFNASTAQQSLLGIINNANQTVEAFISKSGLQSWLGAINLTEIGHFFQNLTKFFKIGDFKLLPTGTGAGSFNIATAAGKFIEDFINKATGFLIDPLKILGINNTGNLKDDVSARPALQSLLNWVTGTTTTNPFDTFFTNIKNLFGGNINLLGTTFNASTAQQSLVTLIANANNTVGVLAKQADMALKAGIADIVERITGTAGATTLSGLSTFFAGLIPNTIAGASALLTKVVDNITSAVTGGTATLTNFFAGLGGGTATATSLVHKIVSSITGNSGSTQTLQSLGTFFGNFTSSATTLVGKVVDQITGLVTNGLAGLNLTQFFSGFNGATTATDSLAHKISQAVSGGAATTMTQVDQFFKNIRTFLGIGTTGINLSDFLGDATAFGTKLTGIVNSFITNVLQRNGLSTTLVALTGGATQLGEGLIPTLPVGKIDNLVSTITGGVTNAVGDLQKFFTNLRTFLGGGSGFLAGTFSLSAAVENFISNVLKAPAIGTKLVTLNAQSKLDNGIIPALAIDNIENLVETLTGTVGVSGDVQKFFTNLRSFLGGASSFLGDPGTFSTSTVAENFINNVLRGSGVATRLAALKSGTNFLDPDQIPELAITKIKDLITTLTGSGTVVEDVQKFFTNLRGLFGSTNWLVPAAGTAGGFNLVTAANQFVTTVLSKATAAGVGASKITADIFSDFSLDKVVNLAKALTGQTVTGATGDLLAVQRFFSGFTSFDPNTGANSLVQQITNSIFGTNGTLAQLKTFFSGFIPATGAFDPGTGNNNLASQITKAVTGTAGVLTDILAFFGIGPSTDPTTLNPLTAANSFLNQIVNKITGTGSTLTHLNQFFANLRTAFGFTAPADLYSPTQTATSLQTTIFNVIKGFNSGTGANALISQDKLKEWLGASSTNTLTQLGSFFGNLKTFFGGTTDGSIDLLAGPINFVTAVDNFIKGILNKGTAGLFNVNLLPSLDITKIGNLVNYITGKTTGGQATDIDVFFGNIRRMFNHGTDTTQNQVNLNATQTASALQGGLFEVIAKINTDLGAVGKALLTNTGLFSTLGGTATADIKKFFDNIKLLLGGPTLIPGASASFEASTEIGKLFPLLSASTTGLLAPAKIATVSTGTGTLVQDLTARPILTDLRSWLTTSDANSNENIQKFFTNLRATLGNPTLLPAGAFDNAARTAAQQSLHTTIKTINDNIADTASKFATEQLANAKATIDTLVKAITGGTGTYNDLSRVTSFFEDLGDYAGSGTTLVNQLVKNITGTTSNSLMGLTSLKDFFSGFTAYTGTGTSLISQIVSKITGGASQTLNDLNTFFTNFKSLFTGINFTTATASFSANNAITTFTDKLFGGSGLMPQLNKYVLTISGAPTGGSYRLTYGGTDITGTLSYDVGAATIQTALEGLPSIGTGKATVTADGPTSFEISIDNLTASLEVYSKSLSGGVTPDVTVERKLSSSLIPQLNVDWIKDLEDWINRTLVEPLVQILRAGTGDGGEETEEVNGLTALGVWASNLLTGRSKIPAENLDGTIDNALLGVIPVANISNTSPNLLTQGGFTAATNLSATDQWTWDDTESRSGTNGSAKLAFTAAGTKELFSQQKIPVVPGDTLNLSAYVKTAAIANGTATYTLVITGSPTAGTFRLSYAGQSTSSLAYNATPAAVLAALADLPSIGEGNATVSGTAGVSYTIVINNLTSALTATTDFYGPRVFNLNITGQPLSGDYKLFYNGVSTINLNHAANAATIQTELNKLTSIANTATVTGSNRNFQVSLSGTRPSTLGVTSTLTTRTHAVALSNTPTGGTFALTYGTAATPALNHNITPANLQAELIKLDGIDSATVTGTAGSAYSIWLDNQTSTLSVSSSLLANAGMPGVSIAPVAATTPTVAVTGSGPYTVTLSGSPTGSTFTLSYGGSSTTGLSPTAAPSLVQSALELLPSIGTGKATVTGTAGSYTITLAVATSTLTAASSLTDSDYTVTLTNTPTSGTFTLSYAGQTTAAIPYNATTTQVRDALALLTNIGASNVTVGGAVGAYTVAFKIIGTLTGSDAALRNAVSPLTTVTASTVSATPRMGGRYSVVLSGTPTGGSYRLGYAGQITAAINHNADAAAVRTALEALSSIGTGSVIVTAITGGFTVDIANYTGTLSVDSNDLTSATVAAVAVTNNHRTPTGDNIFVAVPPSTPNGGTFTLNYGGATVASALPHTATATNVRDALAALASVGGTGNVTVAGSLGSFTVTIKATRQTLTATDTFLSLTTFSPEANVTEITPMAAVTGGSYTVALTGSPTGGSFTLSYGTQTTAAIAHNATAATVRQALEALPALGVGKVGVTGSSPTWTISIAGEVTTLAVNSAALTGGTAPRVSVEDRARPLALTLLPYNNNTALSPATVVTTRPVAAWTQISGFWTVPANVTSVFTRLSYGGTATSGSVWFDDTSLTKVGLMQQSLVDRLQEAWRGLWDGAFGSGGEDKTSDDAGAVLGFVSSTANNGVVNAAAADGKAQTIADGVEEAMTGQAPPVGGAAPGAVKTHLQGLNLNLFGQNFLGTELQLPAIPDIPVGKSLDMRGIFNNVVLGLQGKTSTAISGTGLPGLDDIFKSAKAANDAITTLGQAVAGLQTNATNTSNSGKSDFTDFSSFSPFNNNVGLLYSGASTSALVSSGGQAVWQISGQGTRWAQGVFTRTATNTNWQKVGIAFGSAPEADWLSNTNPAFNYILGRVNNTYTVEAGDNTLAGPIGTVVSRGQHYVFVKFSKTSFTVGYTTNGTAATPTETLFPAPTGGWPYAHEFTPGAVYYLECGTDAGQTVYRVSRNGTPLLTIPATGAYPYTDAEHRFSGFKVQATSNTVWTRVPGSMAAFAMADNTPAEYIGSGFRRFRSSTTPTAIARGDTGGYSLLPDDFFGSTSYATPDYNYTTSSAVPNKITVDATGWYQVTTNLALANQSMLTELAPTLYKNGVLNARGGSVWGLPGFPARGPSQASATFTVYLQKGEYIQPGYWQNPGLSGSNGYASGNWVGDSNGVTSYIQVAFLNRSTAN